MEGLASRQSSVDNHGMIIFRRVVAVWLGLSLLVFLVAAIAVEEFHDRVLSPDHLKSELLRLDVYTFWNDDVYPAAVRNLLENPDDVLPDSLDGAEIPRDQAAQEAIVRLMRVVVPPSYVQEQTEDLIDQFIPYLLNDSDTIAIQPRFDERLRAATELGTGGNGQSELEIAFRELDLGRLIVDELIDGKIEEFEETDPAAALALRLADREDAAEWFTESMFSSLETLVPFLLGERDDFEIEVSFRGRENLAPAFAALLDRTPESLARDGYILNEADFEERIGVSLDSVVDDPRNNLEALQSGWTLTLEEIYGTDPAGLQTRADVDEVRKWVGRLTTSVRWGLFAVVAVLAIAIGLLGGRRWSTRILWGAGALFISAVLVAAVAGPLYDGVAADEIQDALRDDSDDWPATLIENRIRIIDDFEAILDSATSGFADEALLLLLASGALVIVSGAWAYRESQTDARGHGGDRPTGLPGDDPLANAPWRRGQASAAPTAGIPRVSASPESPGASDRSAPHVAPPAPPSPPPEAPHDHRDE